MKQLSLVIILAILAVVLSGKIVFAQEEQGETLTHLGLGDSITLTIEANIPKTATGIQCKKGEVYQIIANGEWQDAGYPASDANGFKGFTFAMYIGMLLKPMPSQKYMKLTGKLGPFYRFGIGTNKELQVGRNGELLLIPNDARMFYNNNHGALEVTIKRTK